MQLRLSFTTPLTTNHADTVIEVPTDPTDTTLCQVVATLLARDVVESVAITYINGDIIAFREESHNAND